MLQYQALHCQNPLSLSGLHGCMESVENMFLNFLFVILWKNYYRLRLTKDHRHSPAESPTLPCGLKTSVGNLPRVSACTKRVIFLVAVTWDFFPAWLPVKRVQTTPGLSFLFKAVCSEPRAPAGNAHLHILLQFADEKHPKETVTVWHPNAGPSWTGFKNMTCCSFSRVLQTEPRPPFRNHF